MRDVLGRRRRGWLLAGVALVVVIVVVLRATGRLGGPEDDGQGGRDEPESAVVDSVTDGDTLRLTDGDAVRLVGIDAPERGACGSRRAARLLAELTAGKEVTLTAPVDDHDRYGRLLRYVDVGSIDAGLRMIENGLAIARYDSRDGYDAHPREQEYVRADAASAEVTCAR